MFQEFCLTVCRTTKIMEKYFKRLPQKTKDGNQKVYPKMTT